MLSQRNYQCCLMVIGAGNRIMMRLASGDLDFVAANSSKDGWR